MWRAHDRLSQTTQTAWEWSRNIIRKRRVRDPMSVSWTLHARCKRQGRSAEEALAQLQVAIDTVTQSKGL